MTQDAPGASALAAAWALLRSRSVDEASRDWVSARIAALSPTRGAGLAAAALLAAARGDLEGARCLMRGVRDLSPAACPPIARHAASSFLAADGAARGAWAEVAELGASLRADGREAWLLSGVAKGLLLEPDAPRGAGLWWRWALAPHRRATLPLVQRALAALDGAFIPADEAFAAPIDVREAGAFDRAMALHASLLAREGDAVGAAELRASAQAWDEVLDDAALARQVEARAAALGTGGAAAALGQLRQTVDDDLAALALAADVPLADLGTAGATAARVRSALRDRLLRDVEVASDALRRRVDERRALPGADEWREWAALAAIHARGVRLAGAELRQLAFHKVHPDATHFAVWLFNDRKERALANAVFRFLHAEAIAVDDATAAGLQQKNIDCGV